ncbi:MAG: hypothetical protein J0L97_07545 [Alphaproteobacteria bacterium]|nr:hypothetical protein [Alphaproteobacteria bacterium]
MLATLDSELASRAAALGKQLGTDFPRMAAVRELERQYASPEGLQDTDKCTATVILSAYAQWLEAFAILAHEQLAPEDCWRVLRMADVLSCFVYDDMLIGTFDTFHNVPRSYRPEAAEGYGYSAEIMDYAQKKMAVLEQEGEVYLLAGYRRHHAVGRITRYDNGRYGYTEFNAGAEATPVTPIPGCVLGEETHYVREGADIPRFIRTLAEKKLRIRSDEGFPVLNAEKAAALEDAVVSCREVSKQRGNECASLSTRLMLEEALGEGTMRAFADFVTGAQLQSGKELGEALRRAVGEEARFPRGMT